LEFTISSTSDCTPTEHYTATTYCSNVLHASVVIQLGIEIGNVLVSAQDQLSVSIITHALLSIFPNSGSRVMLGNIIQTSDSTLVYASISIPVSYYGYSERSYESTRAVSDLCESTITSAFETDIFSSNINEEIQVLSSGGHISTLAKHGTISLILVEGMQFQNTLEADANLGPISYYFSTSDSQSTSLMSHPLAFLSFVLFLAVFALSTVIWRGTTIFR
jgi:hypothetical protein